MTCTVTATEASQVQQFQQLCEQLKEASGDGFFDRTSVHDLGALEWQTQWGDPPKKVAKEWNSTEQWKKGPWWLFRVFFGDEISYPVI